MRPVIYIFIAYLIGTIPFGLLTARMVKGVDIRKYGSGNIGATNVFRVVGKKWGILVFVLDAVKGALAVLLPAWMSGASSVSPWVIGWGVAAILGHSFPLWLGFKGGKGVATSLGVFLAIVPVPAIITFGLWTVVFLFSRILSVASLAAALLFPVILFATIRGTEIFRWVFPVSFLLAIFIVYTHRSNLRRLFDGEEKKLF